MKEGDAAMPARCLGGRARLFATLSLSFGFFIMIDHFRRISAGYAARPLAHHAGIAS